MWCWEWSVACVKAKRRGGDALGVRKLNGFERGGKHVFRDRSFIRRKLSKDMANHFARAASADADFEAGEGVGPQMLDDRFDAVVAARGAFFPKSEGSER